MNKDDAGSDSSSDFSNHSSSDLSSDSEDDGIKTSLPVTVQQKRSADSDSSSNSSSDSEEEFAWSNRTDFDNLTEEVDDPEEDDAIDTGLMLVISLLSVISHLLSDTSQLLKNKSNIHHSRGEVRAAKVLGNKLHLQTNNDGDKQQSNTIKRGTSKPTAILNPVPARQGTPHDDGAAHLFTNKSNINDGEGKVRAPKALVVDNFQQPAPNSGVMSRLSKPTVPPKKPATTVPPKNPTTTVPTKQAKKNTTEKKQQSNKKQKSNTAHTNYSKPTAGYMSVQMCRADEQAKREKKIKEEQDLFCSPVGSPQRNTFIIPRMGVNNSSF